MLDNAWIKTWTVSWAWESRYVPVPKGDVHKKKEVVQVGTERQPSSGDHPKWRLISALYTHTHIVVAWNLMKLRLNWLNPFLNPLDDLDVHFKLSKGWPILCGAIGITGIIGIVWNRRQDVTLHDLDQANAKPQGGQERLGRVAVSESLKLEATGSPSRLVSLLGIAVHRII